MLATIEKAIVVRKWQSQKGAHNLEVMVANGDNSESFHLWSKEIGFDQVPLLTPVKITAVLGGFKVEGNQFLSVKSIEIDLIK